MYKEKWKSFISRNQDRVWFSFALNLVVLAAMLLMMEPAFETNDDTTLREFVSGARTLTSPCLLFQHYFLGALYRLLYRWTGAIPWYTLIQYAVLFLSFTAVTYVVLRKLRGTAGFCVASVLLFYFAKEYYITMQFTKTASAAMCAGVLLLFYALDAEDRVSRRAVVCGILLGCVGSMYRFKQSVACAALMTGIGLFVLLRMARKDPHGWLRGIFPYLKVFALFGLCVLVLYGIDLYSYRLHPRWLEYSRYNDLRSDLMDYGIPDFGANEELYSELDIDSDAFLLYSGWNYNDPDKLSPEIIETLLERQPKRKPGLSVIKDFLKEFPAKYFHTYTFYPFLILGVLWLFCGYHRREDILSVLYVIVLFGLFYFYMYFTKRYAINRVDAGLWLALALTAFWFLDARRMNFSLQTAGIFCLCLLAVNQSNWKDHWHIYHRQDTAAREETRSFVEELARDQDHLYLVKIGYMLTSKAYGMFDRIPEGTLDNIYLMGGWDCSTPEAQDSAALYGVTNPYRDMIDNPAVYIVDDKIDLTLAYLQKYYDPEAKAVLIRKSDGRKIYQIVTGSVD